MVSSIIPSAPPKIKQRCRGAAEEEQEAEAEQQYQQYQQEQEHQHEQQYNTGGYYGDDGQWLVITLNILQMFMNAQMHRCTDA